jgi:hypothetical protein
MRLYPIVIHFTIAGLENRIDGLINNRSSKQHFIIEFLPEIMKAGPFKKSQSVT